MKMYILSPQMRSNFIDNLRPTYARNLPQKNIENREDIMFGAKNLYLSGTPFAQRGTERQVRATDTLLVESALVPFVEKVWFYFNQMPAPTRQAEFDQFHEELCDIFLNRFYDFGYVHNYGNAQKQVNVLFKYLSCYADAAQYAEWFKYCHMALDGYTYNSYRLPFYLKVVHEALHNYPAGKLTAWSKFTRSEYKVVTSDIISYISANPKTYNDYLDICAHFPILENIPRLSPKKDYVLTPFEAEFFIWLIAKNCFEKDPAGAYIYNISLVNEIKHML